MGNEVEILDLACMGPSELSKLLFDINGLSGVEVAKKVVGSIDMYSMIMNTDFTTMTDDEIKGFVDKLLELSDGELKNATLLIIDNNKYNVLGGYLYGLYTSNDRLRNALFEIS